jgi:hypothetical protein
MLMVTSVVRRFVPMMLMVMARAPNVDMRLPTWIIRRRAGMPVRHHSQLAGKVSKEPKDGDSAVEHL